MMICANSALAQTAAPKWKIHDLDRPVPTGDHPGTSSTPDSPGKAPSDAIVLFDGKDLAVAHMKIMAPRSGKWRTATLKL